MTDEKNNELIPVNIPAPAEHLQTPELTETEPEPRNGLFILKLKKPFEYCGKTYEEITFDFDNLTGKDMLAVEREVNLASEFFLVPETSPNFCGKLAARAAGLSSDVIENLPIKEFKRAKEAAQNFLNDLELEKA